MILFTSHLSIVLILTGLRLDNKMSSHIAMIQGNSLRWWNIVNFRILATRSDLYFSKTAEYFNENGVTGSIYLKDGIPFGNGGDIGL